VSWIAIGALALGTYLFRLAGPLLRDRLVLPASVRHYLTLAAVVLLSALVATAALFAGASFAGFARPAGVVVGGVLAWRRLPFVVVVLGAAGTAALLRLAGVP